MLYRYSRRPARTGRAFCPFFGQAPRIGFFAVAALFLRCVIATAQSSQPAPASETEGRFQRWYWYEPGLEHGNPVVNSRFRVNAPDVVAHPQWATRQEVRGNGMMQILMEEDLRWLTGAELYLELWGGHPGSANKRVTPNGRATYFLPKVGSEAENCAYYYPLVPLRVSDLVNGYNALQFAVDQGTTFWGHFIVDNACLRAELTHRHPDLVRAGLADFRPTANAAPATDGSEVIQVSLSVPEASLSAVESVDFEGFFDGYDENGDRQSRDWHGFTKQRRPVAILGTARQAPFAISWDTKMLPDQKEVGVRALVHFKGQSNLVYVTPSTLGVRLPQRKGRVVRLFPASNLPVPFWSRANQKRECAIVLDVARRQIEQAELHLVVWDGGAGTVQDYFKLNGHPLKIAGAGKHDIIYSKLQLDPAILERGTNRIELLSDTDHHGVEVCLPGPALMVRYRTDGNR
jgi:hypothetical protein